MVKDSDKGKGLQIDIILDTDVDGKYISPKMADKIGNSRKHKGASDELRTRSGFSGVCTYASDSFMLTVELKQQVFMTLYP